MCWNTQSTFHEACLQLSFNDLYTLHYMAPLLVICTLLSILVILKTQSEKLNAKTYLCDLCELNTLMCFSGRAVMHHNTRFTV